MSSMPFTEGYKILKSKAQQAVITVKASKFFPKMKRTTLPYAYPCKNYLDPILSNEIVHSALQLFVDTNCKKQIQNIKSTGQLVTKDNYPQFYNLLQSCYKSLNVEEVPEVYITGKLKGINALSVGTDSAPLILVSSKSVVGLPEGELKFMIGHELGHILQKNLMCHTIKGLLDNLNRKSDVFGPLVSDIIEVPLNQWYRCAEYTADRAGLICCGSISHVKSLFTRLSNSAMRPNNQIEKYFELSNIHPLYNSRIEMLEQFVLSQQKDIV